MYLLATQAFLLFQFHIVRLKASLYTLIETPFLFQFHIVRLKDNVCFHAQNSFYVISIPYSSIKRAMSGHYRLVVYRFQFHIVRLKVRHLAHAIPYILISIPYSSIKSKVRVPLACVVQEFQFHIVRLKVLCCQGSWQDILYFNSI